MKILTIANPRSGSTYFCEYWAKKYNIPYFSEPKFMDELISSLDNKDGFSIKIVMSQLYEYYHLKSKLSFEESIDEFYKLLSKYEFDKIIMLDRRDKVDHTESIINLFTTQRGNEFNQWAYNDDFKKSITNDMWDKWNSYVNESTKWLTAVSEKFNIPIVYYEDIYYNPNSVDLQGLEFKPDLSKKQRKNSSNSII
jgi:hypothetical protein